MVRRILLILVPLLLVQPPLEALQSSEERRPFSLRGTSQTLDPSELGIEAQVLVGALQAIRDIGLDMEADSALWDKAIRGLIRELDDPYAAVLTPDEVRAFEEESTGNYAGIGVQITELNEAVTVTAVFRNTPADREGLQVGDRIVAVDGADARGWSVSEASDQIRGEPGTEVEVTVERPGIPRPMPHRIRREQVHVPAVTSERIFQDVGYVHLDRVARNSAVEVDSVLTELGDTRGLILDLRRNPGGYLDESLNLADLFLDRGSVLVTTRSRVPGSQGNLREESAYARRAARAANTPIIVLVDRFSASASEIVAGALQDHDRALVLGERTFGKGTVQSVVPLPGDYMIRLTSGEWYTPRGRSLNRPRDREGRVLTPDSIPRFTSESGRTLWGGGGVFPDLEIAADTLTTSEQRFVGATIEAEIPLAQRIQEAAFAAAQEVRDRGTIPETLPAGVLRAFRDGLVEDGVGESYIDDEVEGYLNWRLEVAFFERLERRDLALQSQAGRDPVLARAVELLSRAGSQSELFALVPAPDRPDPEGDDEPTDEPGSQP
jgi:carboxyl-terminal processing protease